jgi:aspartyl-tRNA synthetase
MNKRQYTHDITPEMDGETVSVAGWAHEIRDLGGITFIILRDREGEIQTIFKEDEDEELFEKAQNVGKEDVIHVTGTVEENDQAPGDCEIHPENMEIIGEAESPLPMDVTSEIDSDMSTRLDNRFMDLRRPEIHSIFSLRSHLIESMEEWFDKNEYINIQTPTIAKMGEQNYSP